MEYKKKIVKLLEGHHTNSRVVVGGLEPSLPTQPLLKVNGFGTVALPLNKFQAPALEAVMERAPYGLGEETIVDCTVRDSWQLPPTHFQLGNEKFVKAVEGDLVRRVKVGLGLGDNVEVRAELYKLIYNKTGGHFKAHRDTEKAEGMFGTLIVQLPSEFTGGDLVVRHSGKNEVIEMAQFGSDCNCLYAAHYSDCEHQLMEVKSGHRLALVYSLCWRGVGVAPSADMNTGVANTLQGLLSSYAAETPHQPRICWALEHLYSENSLYTSGVAALKGQDRKIVDMILTATSELQDEEKFEIYLAEATRSVEEYGECTRDYGYRYRYGNRYYGSGSDCFDHCGDTEDSSKELKKFVSLTGDIYQTVGDEFVAEDEVLNYPSDKKKDNKRKRYSESSDYTEEFWGEGTGECSGPSGNEGATRNMWYRRVLLVMWRRADSIRVKCKQNITAGLLHVVNTCGTDMSKARKEAEQVLDVAKGMVTRNTVELCSALDMAAALHDLSICRDVFKVFFFQPKIVTNYSDELVKKLRLCVSMYTMGAIKDFILELIEASNADNIGYFADMLFDQDVDATMCKSLISKLEPITEIKDSEWQLSRFRYSSITSQKEINIIEASVKLVDLFFKQGERVFAQFMESFFLNLNKLASAAQLKICAETIGSMSEKLAKYFNEDKVGSFLTKAFDIVFGSEKLMESMESLEILLNMLLKYKQNGCLEKLAKRTLIHENKQNILTKMLKSLDSTKQISNPDVLNLINERVKYLQIATANGPPKFSWHQPDAVVPGHPKVEAFFRSNQETFTYQEFTGIKHARNWASKHSNDAGTKAIFKPGGIGKNAYVTVTKAKAGFEMQKESYTAKVVEKHRLMACLPNQDNVVPTGVGTTLSDSDAIVIESD